MRDLHLNLRQNHILGFRHPMTRGYLMYKLEQLIAAAKKVVPSAQEKEEQRRSFAYGNTHIENPRITRATVNEEAEALTAPSK